ncbi:hypothetical protein [Modestobacter versicolor]|uniref:hypothetical protein n=1 Tax=Modestobacter versicolor TaxID=429133 RepID=UPI0034E03F7F
MLTRVADGRADVVREIAAAAPLMADLSAPVTARGPWLTAALNASATGRLSRVRPRAVVVEQGPPGRPDGLALLAFRRRAVGTSVTLLGADAGPLPEGRPQNRLHARDDDIAARLAAGVADLLGALRGPWTMRLSGLPLGDPTLRHLAALLPDSSLATARSRRLVDELDTVGAVARSREPAELDRRLPAVLDRVPSSGRALLRTAARLHAANGRLEVAVVPGAGGPAAVLLTLVDPHPGGEDRWPWWGSTDVGGLRRELGSPGVTLTVSAGLARLGRG